MIPIFFLLILSYLPVTTEVNNVKNEIDDIPQKIAFRLSPLQYDSGKSVGENKKINNKSKEKWLIDYKVSTTRVGSLKDHCSEINILIFAQQMSIARPRKLFLSAINGRELEFYYHNDKKAHINPIISNNITIDLDKTADENYEKVMDNKAIGITQKYVEMKRPKVKMVVKMREKKEYKIKIFLTTSLYHFNHLHWTPALI